MIQVLERKITIAFNDDEIRNLVEMAQYALKYTNSSPVEPRWEELEQ